LIDKDSQTPFGPVVWCQINVDSSLALTSVGANGSADVPSATPAAAMNAAGNGVDVALSTEDLFMFVKTLEKTTKKSKASGRGECGLLAVPTNTPLGMCLCHHIFVSFNVIRLLANVRGVEFAVCCRAGCRINQLL
jgi:hypothetical protein